MTIFLTLNEEFKAPVQVMNVPDFIEKVKSLIRNHPANQTLIRKEFEVRKIKFPHLITFFIVCVFIF